MKRLVAIACLLALFASPAWASKAPVHVRGHMRSNGTYVQPHYRSGADHTVRNNWSTRGNVNPYTGKHGTRSYYGRR